MNIEELLASPESSALEFKEQCPALSRLAELLCAFANTSGGDLIIGVEDRSRKVIGVDEKRIIDVEESASNVAATALFPPIYPIIKSIRYANKSLLWIHVDMGYQKPYCIRKKNRRKFFVRIGSSTREADSASVEIMRLESKGISWDGLPCADIGLKSLDTSLIEDYLQQRYAARAIPKPRAITDAWLVKSRFAAESNGRLYPTNGAVLLFSSEVSFVFPSSGIEFARFAGKSPRNFVDKQSLEGPILSLYNQAAVLLRKHVPVYAERTSGKRSEVQAYPVVAFREFMVNAICHRIYAHPSSSTKVAVFDDIIEITNSGGLHQGIDLEDLGTGISLLRNQVIARAFNEVGLIEGWGTGIKVAQEALAEYHFPKAAFRVKGSFFQVSSAWRWPDTLSSREKEILKAAASAGRIESKAIAEKMNITDRGARKIIMQLVRKGLMKKIGTTKSTQYQLP